VTGLLAQHDYAFAVVATNQYNLSSSDNANVLYVTTLDPTLPSHPRDVAVTEVLGGSFVVTYSPVADTGGYSHDDIIYIVVVSELTNCYRQGTGCSSCSHYARSSSSPHELMIEMLGTANCGISSTCSGDAPCCRVSDTNECGIRTDRYVDCPAIATGAVCRVAGLESSTNYNVAVMGANAVGNSSLSPTLGVTTR
jgi:hypothetical protein